MKAIKLWYPSHVTTPLNLLLDDDIASGLVRAGVAAATDPGEAGSLGSGGALSAETPVTIAVPEGRQGQLQRIVVPAAVASIAASGGRAAIVSADVVVTPTPTPTPTLNALTVSPNVATVGAPYTGTVTGKTAGSTLALTGAGAVGLNVSGTTISGTPTAAGAVNLFESLAGATNTPRTSPAVIAVAAMAEAVPLVFPSAAWTGDPNSPNATAQNVASTTGYTGVGAGTGYGSTPVDASTVGRRAGLRLLTPEGQWFDSNDLDFGFDAFVPGGFQSVTILCEGNEFPVSMTKWTNTSNLDGTTQKDTWGYWAKLDHSAFPRDGGCNLYVRLVPNDTTNFDTVIAGPFYYERVTILHPWVYEIRPSLGADNPTARQYRTLDPALLHAGYSNQRHNSLFLLMETGDYDMGNSQNFTWANSRGRFHVRRGSAAVQVNFRRAGSPGVMRTRQGSTKIQGPGIRIDLKTYTGGLLQRESSGTDDRGGWLDGVELYSSDGRDTQAFWPEMNLLANSGKSHRQAGWFTDCHLHDTIWGYTGVAHIRNCTLYNIAGDLTQFAWGIHGFFGDLQNNDFYRDPKNALVMNYTGAAATATVHKTGTNGLAAGTLVITLDGTPNTITLAGKTVAQVRTEINAITGAADTAVASANEAFWPAIFLTIAGTSGFGAFGTVGGIPTTPVNIKNTPLQLVTAVDVHGDITQQPEDGFVYCNVSGTRLKGAQLIFLNIRTTYSDCYIINYLGDAGYASFGLSQFYGAHRNVNIWHVTVVDQIYALRSAQTNPYSAPGPAKNSIRNCVLEGISIEVTPPTNTVFQDNHVRDGTKVPAQAAASSSIGGTTGTLFVNYAGADYTPNLAGPLSTNKVAPVVPFDLNNKLRQPLDAKGAIAFAA